MKKLLVLLGLTSLLIGCAYDSDSDHSEEIYTKHELELLPNGEIVDLIGRSNIRVVYKLTGKDIDTKSKRNVKYSFIKDGKSYIEIHKGKLLEEDTYHFYINLNDRK